MQLKTGPSGVQESEGVFAAEYIPCGQIILNLEGDLQPFSPFPQPEKTFRVDNKMNLAVRGIGASIVDNVDFRKLTYEETEALFVGKQLPRKPTPHNCKLVTGDDQTLSVESTADIPEGSELVLDYGFQNWAPKFIFGHQIDYGYHVESARW